MCTSDVELISEAELRRTASRERQAELLRERVRMREGGGVGRGRVTRASLGGMGETESVFVGKLPAREAIYTCRYV